MRIRQPFNVHGIKAVTVPCGFSKSGLPMGLTFAGPHFSEGKILALARAFERGHRVAQAPSRRFAHDAGAAGPRTCETTARTATGVGPAAALSWLTQDRVMLTQLHRIQHAVSRGTHCGLSDRCAFPTPAGTDQSITRRIRCRLDGERNVSFRP